MYTKNCFIQISKQDLQFSKSFQTLFIVSQSSNFYGIYKPLKRKLNKVPFRIFSFFFRFRVNVGGYLILDRKKSILENDVSDSSKHYKQKI